MNLRYEPSPLAPNEVLRVYVNTINVGTLYVEVDGFWVFVPDRSRGGFVEAWFLRALADKLDSLNADWQANIDDYCNNNPQQPEPDYDFSSVEK